MQLTAIRSIGPRRSAKGLWNAYQPETEDFRADGTWGDWVKKKAVEARLARWRKGFASVLSQCRRDADLAQWQVAEEMGWTRNTVTKIEGGHRSVNAEEFMELCRLYRSDPLIVLGRVTRW